MIRRLHRYQIEQCPTRPPKIPRLRNLAITPHQSVAHLRFLTIHTHSKRSKHKKTPLNFERSVQVHSKKQNNPKKTRQKI